MTQNQTWGFAELPLTNLESVEKGELACIDTSTGLVVKGQVSLTLRPIGYFESDATGDGATEVRIRLFREIRLHKWDNDDGGTPVVVADIGSLCYILDDRTVSGSTGGATRTAAGRVWAVASDGVLVEMAGFNAV